MFSEIVIKGQHLFITEVYQEKLSAKYKWALLLTWLNFNPSIDE